MGGRCRTSRASPGQSLRSIEGGQNPAFFAKSTTRPIDFAPLSHGYLNSPAPVEGRSERTAFGIPSITFLFWSDARAYQSRCPLGGRHPPIPPIPPFGGVLPRVLGRLALMDEATCWGGRRPRSLGGRRAVRSAMPRGITHLSFLFRLRAGLGEPFARLKRQSLAAWPWPLVGA
jgi:hypothetical protein